MKFAFPIFLLICHTAHASISLKEAFQAARLNMETLKRADAVIDQRKEQKDIVRGSLLPSINAVGAYSRIDAPNVSGVNNAFILTRQYSAAIRLSQPLLRGGSIAAYQLANEDILLAKFQKDASEINLYQLVINSYYNLYLAQVDLKNLSQSVNLSKDQVKEISERTRVGRSRRGELVQAQAQLATAEAQYQQGQINLKEAQRNFEFYTQLKPENIENLGTLPKEIGTLSVFTSRIKSRPDIMVANQEVALAEKRISIAKGGHYPSLDLTSNYYLKRTGVLATSDWDVGLAVNIPIYQGGTVQSAVRQAVDVKRAAQLTSSENTRAAERDVSILYQTYLQLQTQLSNAKDAMGKSEEAYKLSRRDYQYGQVTNLDVLVSLNLYISAKRSYDNIFTLTHMTYKNLEAAVGVLP